mgnify:FL=1
MNLEKGTVVKSLCGRDKNKYFYVLDKQGDYVLYCDGCVRRLEKPKRKKLKHVEVTRVKLQTEILQVNKHIKKALTSLNIVEE